MVRARPQCSTRPTKRSGESIEPFSVATEALLAQGRTLEDLKVAKIAGTADLLVAASYTRFKNKANRVQRFDGNRRIELSVPLDPAFAGITLFMQAHDPPTQRISNLVVQTF